MGHGPRGAELQTETGHRLEARHAASSEEEGGTPTSKLKSQLLRRAAAEEGQGRERTTSSHLFCPSAHLPSSVLVPCGPHLSDSRGGASDDDDAAAEGGGATQTQPEEQPADDGERVEQQGERMEQQEAAERNSRHQSHLEHLQHHGTATATASEAARLWPRDATRSRAESKFNRVLLLFGTASA